MPFKASNGKSGGMCFRSTICVSFIATREESMDSLLLLQTNFDRLDPFLRGPRPSRRPRENGDSWTRNKSSRKRGWCGGHVGVDVPRLALRLAGVGRDDRQRRHHYNDLPVIPDVRGRLRIVSDHLPTFRRIKPARRVSARQFPDFRPGSIDLLAFRSGVSGNSSSTRSCMTFGVMRPRSPRSRRTRPSLQKLGAAWLEIFWRLRHNSEAPNLSTA
jgi:hypothetical protein